VRARSFVRRCGWSLALAKADESLERSHRLATHPTSRRARNPERASVSDKPHTKIALSSVANLQQLLDEAPTRSDTEVSKRRAIVLLAPKLYGLRSKGYSWRDVAEWLTEHGLTVSAPALQGYLRGSQETDASHGKTKRSKRRPGSHPNREAATSRGQTGASPVVALSPPHAGQGTTTTKPNHAGSLPAPRGPEQSQARSAFLPRPDTKDI
jgi:hypothetical protein